MNKKLYSSKKSDKKISYDLSEEKIVIFKESPSSGSFDSEELGGKNNLKAHELFSLFTADIIKEKVPFIR